MPPSEVPDRAKRVRFDAAPRFLGIDQRGREILSYIDGFVPDNIEADLTDDQLVIAARLLRRFHDATAGSASAGRDEVVCHNDISPVNTVFIRGRPTALIDFDMARPGPRIRDVSYGRTRAESGGAALRAPDHPTQG